VLGALHSREGPQQEIWRSRYVDAIASEHLMVAQMSMVSARLGFVFAFAVLCLDARAAHAQAVPYWTSGWPSAFAAPQQPFTAMWHWL